MIPFWESLGIDRYRRLDQPGYAPLAGHLNETENAPDWVLGHLTNLLPLRVLRSRLLDLRAEIEPSGTLASLARLPEPEEVRVWPGQPISNGPALDNSSLTLLPSELYRPLRHYLELARITGFEIAPPHCVDRKERLYAFRWVPVPLQSRELAPSEENEAKYGVDSNYREFLRSEEPECLDDIAYAFSRLQPRSGERLLSLGCNDALELEAVELPEGLKIVGVDSAQTAISQARLKFPQGHFFAADLRDFSSIELPYPTFELVVILNVLQCRTVDRDRLLSEVFQLATPQTRFAFSLPNCHRGSREILRRPRRRHPRHNRSLVFKDIRYLARRLHRQGYRVETFGTYDLYVVGLTQGSKRGRQTD